MRILNHTIIKSSAIPARRGFSKLVIAVMIAIMMMKTVIIRNLMPESSMVIL